MNAMTETGKTVWRTEHADRFAIVIDGADYFRALKDAMTCAREQILMIGWDFDTRITLEPEGTTIQGPNELGAFLNWFMEERPEVDLRVLKWNLGMMESLKRGETPLYIADWVMRRGINLKLDAAHPPIASHHQKFVVIDDRLAFCGGIDLTKGRWDTRAHRDDDPHRKSRRGQPLGPWHDATTCADGALAKALGDLGRLRWRRATGEDLPVPTAESDPWPGDLTPQFRDATVGISRTMGAFEDYPQVSEIEAMTFAAIADVRETLYIESQYFASRRIVEAMIARLQELDGPEIVVINPQSQDGFLEEATMGAARSKLLQHIKANDPHDRFRLFYPVTEGREPIYVHAKIMIVDDRLVKVGSANLNNRSMGFDTECDLSIEAAPEDTELRASVRAIREDLLCEHLCLTPERLATSLAETGSLVATIEAHRTEGRGLRALEIRETGPADEALEENDFTDPERPGDLLDAAKRWTGLSKGQP